MTITAIARETPLSADRDCEAETAFLPPLDEEAFRIFYERNARAVWAYLAHITNDRELADDLVQESFYRFLRAGASHESEKHRRSSLFQIARNLARDAARRSRGIRHVEFQEGGDDSVALSNPARTAERVAARTDLSRAMRQMKLSEREMLWLAYAQGASHEEIAEALGVTRGSVKMLLFRARRKLARLLRGEPGEEMRR